MQPSLLALAVLGCDLKLLGCDWLTVVVTLQSLSKIPGRELSVCYESVLSEYSSVALQYPLLVSPHNDPPQDITARTDLKDLAVTTGLDKHLVSKETLFVAQ